jgi:hypothetical protein
MMNFNCVVNDDLSSNMVSWGLARYGMVGKDVASLVCWLVVGSRCLLGEHVSPHVWYGTILLLLRDALGSVSCSAERGRIHYLPVNRMVQEGPMFGKP